MSDEKAVFAEELYTVPPIKRAKIIEINFFRNAATVIFNNGLPHETFDFSLKTLLRYKCTEVIQMHSFEGSRGLLNVLDDGSTVWDNMFTETKGVNVTGIWDPRVLSAIIYRIPNLLQISFTYWQCNDITSILDAIASNLCEEITMHIGKGQMINTLLALGRLGERMGRRIKRLMLVFTDVFPGNPLQLFEENLYKALHPKADVILLFGGEDGYCIKDLENGNNDFCFSHQIRMATNDLYTDDTPYKKYETYEVYFKKTFLIYWYIGSRIGKYKDVVGHEFTPIPPRTFDSTKRFLVPVADDSLRGNTICNAYLSHTDQEYRQNLRYYPGRIETLCGIGSCCTLREPEEEQFESVGRWKLPGWESTTIRKIIYNNHLTEFLTDNGFYIILDNMNKEYQFFRTFSATSRCIFHSTTPLRRYVVTGNMESFMMNTQHVEFTGKWHDEPVFQILRSLQFTITSLTMVRIEIRAIMTVGSICKALPPSTRFRIKTLHFDTRSIYEKSVSSILSGIVDACNLKIYKLNELLIICNEWNGATRSYNIDSKDVVELFYQILEDDGCASVAVINMIDSTNRRSIGFNDESIKVMLPISYHKRDINIGLTRLMKCYLNDRGRLFLTCIDSDSLS